MEVPQRTTLGLKLVGVSLLLGVLGDLVLSNEPWGVSLPIYTLLLAGLAIGISRGLVARLTPAATTLLLAAAGFSLLYVWRDAIELKFINALAVFGLVGLAAVCRSEHLNELRLSEIALKALLVWAAFFGDFCTLVFGDVKWAAALKGKSLEGTNAVGRGLLMAIPLVLVFGALLASADASFSHLLDGFSNLDSEALFTHGAIIGLCAVVTGGLLRRLFLHAPRPVPKAQVPFILPQTYHRPYRDPEAARLGAVELGIVLGSLNLLFGAFVLLQAPYLFGGAKHVLQTANLSYAEYARRGFFELVTVVGLAIPVILGTHALLRTRSVAAERVWRGLSVVMVVLLCVVMQSAVDRMRIYVQLYDLTTLRIYVLAALGWMGAMLLWFLVTTVRGRSQLFPIGALATLLLGVLTVNVLNPDAMVVRHNLTQSRSQKGLDIAYLESLSADALPEILGRFELLTPAAQKEFAQRMLDRQETWNSWRGWTVSRAAATSAIEDRRDALENVAAKQLDPSESAVPTQVVAPR